MSRQTSRPASLQDIDATVKKLTEVTYDCPTRTRSWAALAKSADMEASYVQFLLTGRRSNPTLEVASRLAAAIGISVEDLNRYLKWVRDERQKIDTPDPDSPDGEETECLSS